jgi:hypothetical protein
MDAAPAIKVAMTSGLFSNQRMLQARLTAARHPYKSEVQRVIELCFTRLLDDQATDLG